MRWLVEVSAIGKGETQSFCVDADSWQRALQIVRAHRGDSGAMSGFSIELLEEGYRAVDPVARQRFVVKRASEGTPLSAIDMTAGVGGSKPPPAGGVKPSVAPDKVEPAKPEPTAAAGKAEPAKPEPTKPEPTKPEPPKAEPTKLMVPVAAESKPKGGPPRPGAPKADGKSVPPAAPVSSANGPATLVQPTQVTPQAIPSQPETLPAPTVVAPQPVGAPLPGLPAFTVLSRREEHPSSTAPLSYREYVFVVPPGTVEGVAVGILLGQLDLVQASLSSMRSGKLVQLAVFDETYVGKPPRPPLATLVWKDWRGEPVVSFPRRASVAPPGSRPMESAAVPPLKPASIPPKATLLEPKTTLDDTRALKPDLPPPDTEVTRTDLDIDVHALAKTTETPIFVPPAAVGPVHKTTMLGIPTQAFGSPDASVRPSKSVPPPAPAPAAVAPLAPEPPAAGAHAPAPLKSVPPPAMAPVAPAALKSVPPPAPEPIVPAPVKSVPPPAMAPAKSVPPPAPAMAPAANAFAQTLPLASSGQAIPPPAVLGVEKAPDFTPPPGRMASSSRIPIPKVGSRVSGDELITALFEAMHDLHFLRDAIEGADFCLQLAQEVIPSRAGYAHFFDIERREFCLVRAKGADTAELVGKRHLEGEPILSAAVKARRPLLRGSEDAMTNRYLAVGGAKSLVLAPVMVAGRTLAVFEMVTRTTARRSLRTKRTR